MRKQQKKEIIEVNINNAKHEKTIDIREKMKDLAQKQIIKFNKSFKHDTSEEKLKKQREMKKIITGSVITKKSKNKEEEDPALANLLVDVKEITQSLNHAKDLKYLKEMAKLDKEIKNQITEVRNSGLGMNKEYKSEEKDVTPKAAKRSKIDREKSNASINRDIEHAMVESKKIKLVDKMQKYKPKKVPTEEQNN